MEGGSNSNEAGAASANTRDKPTMSEPKGKKSQVEPFALAESLPVIPASLVEKISKGQYIELSELLQDNILLSKRNVMGSGTTAESGHTHRYKKREFTKDEAGLLSWTQCFVAYTAIVCAQNPNRLGDLLAYMVIMINEARRFKYQGWLTYDEMFRQSAAKSKTTTWSELNGTLYATTFLSQQKGESVTCQTCSSSDHHTSQCALSERKHAYRAASPVSSFRRKRARSKSPEKSTQVCYAWNDGKCTRGNACKYKHYVCLKCGDDHKAMHCTTYKKK